jgi:hypothetical protein
MNELKDDQAESLPQIDDGLICIARKKVNMRTKNLTHQRRL